MYERWVQGLEARRRFFWQGRLPLAIPLGQTLFHAAPRACPSRRPDRSSAFTSCPCLRTFKHKHTPEKNNRKSVMMLMMQQMQGSTSGSSRSRVRSRMMKCNTYKLSRFFLIASSHALIDFLSLRPKFGLADLRVSSSCAMGNRL